MTAPFPEVGELRGAAGSALAEPRDFSRLADRVFRELCRGAAVLMVALAVLLMAVLVAKSWLAIHTVGVAFVTSATWDPEPTHRVFGALAFVYGTLGTSALAMLIAVPLGVGTAAFLSELAPRWVRRPASLLVEMLAAVPSVVYGFWGLAVLAPLVRRLVLGFGGPDFGGVGVFSAGLVLSIMVLPYVAAVSYDACRAVPQSQREGALALGATRWQMIWGAVLPSARPGITSACFLALGRALGETMAVTMLIGNRPETRWSPFAPGDSLASGIANQFTEATYDLYLSALAELGLLLFVLTTAVNATAHWLNPHPSHGKRRTRSVRQKAAPHSGAATPGRHGKGDDVRQPFVVARGTDRLMTAALLLCLVVTLTPLFLILGHLMYHGASALNWDFFLRLPAPVGEPGGGLANALYGSALLVGLATAGAAPVGLLAAIHLAEDRGGRLAATARFVAELLSGVPSVVVGIFAYTVVVMPLGQFSGWAGACALAVLMLPTVLLASEEALRMVPGSLREAAYALGANRCQTVLRVTVPAALPAILTSVFLAVARVSGETAPLLLTAAGNQFWPTSPGDFTPSLPVYIFNYAVSPYPEWHRQAWAAALVLVGVVLLLNFGSRMLTGRGRAAAGRPA